MLGWVAAVQGFLQGLMLLPKPRRTAGPVCGLCSGAPWMGTHPGGKGVLQGRFVFSCCMAWGRGVWASCSPSLLGRKGGQGADVVESGVLSPALSLWNVPLTCLRLCCLRPCCLLQMWTLGQKISKRFCHRPEMPSVTLFRVGKGFKNPEHHLLS